MEGKGAWLTIDIQGESFFVKSTHLLPKQVDVNLTDVDVITYNILTVYREKYYGNIKIEYSI